MTEKELELIQMMEECLEVGEACMKLGHRISKYLRFGPDEKHDNNDSNNLEMIENEFSDLVAIYERTGFRKPTQYRKDKKKQKVKVYMEYSKKLGIIDK